MMKIHVFILAWLVLMNNDGVRSSFLSRLKREAAGALSILTNNAQPIHADVKAETALAITEQPCPKNNNIPSPIENGFVFQVTAPKDAIYEAKSLRKSFLQPSKIELARNISRVATLAVLLVTAIIEFYPLLCKLYKTVHAFIYPN